MASNLVDILYTNHRGEKSWRTIEPAGLLYDQSEFHPGEWTIEAYDLDRKAQRSFALRGIHEWKPAQCITCGWPLRKTVEEGCTHGNCSQRSR